MRRIWPALLTAAVVVAGCGNDDDSSNLRANPQATLQVVATTTVVADFARVVGGDRVGVYGVLKPNVDPHDYEPAPADLDAMKRAKVIVKNGVGLENWLDDTISSSGTKAAIIDTSAGIVVRSGGGKKRADGDPHIWHDPRNAKLMVRTIAKAFTTADPEGATTYAANLMAYTARLDTLDNDIETQVAALTNRKLVTNHDAFGYFVDRYGFEFIGSVIPSFDTSAELSAAELRKLVDAIRTQGVKAVFSESSLPGKTAKAIAREAKVTVVDGGDALYGDGLGKAGSDADTYLTMMRHNARTIVTNLT